MKKKFLATILVLCIVCSLISLVACDGKVIPVESIVLEDTDITLENGEEYTLKFTVTPANGKICFSYDDTLLDYTVVSDGVVKIKTHGSGSGRFRISSAKDSNLFAECNVTVALPQGYSQYKDTNYGVKFAYPSTWKKSTQASTAAVAYQDASGLNNINLIVQNKSNEMFNVESNYYKNLLESQYKQKGYTVTFHNYEFKKYDNNKALRVVMDYSLSYLGISAHIYQEQYIRNSSKKSLALTLTMSGDEVDEELRDTILKEFYAW